MALRLVLANVRFLRRDGFSSFSQIHSADQKQRVPRSCTMVELQDQRHLLGHWVVGNHSLTYNSQVGLLGDREKSF